MTILVFANTKNYKMLKVDAMQIFQNEKTTTHMHPVWYMMQI